MESLGPPVKKFKQARLSFSASPKTVVKDSPVRARSLTATSTTNCADDCQSAVAQSSCATTRRPPADSTRNCSSGSGATGGGPDVKSGTNTALAALNTVPPPPPPLSAGQCCNFQSDESDAMDTSVENKENNNNNSTDGGGRHSLPAKRKSSVSCADDGGTVATAAADDAEEENNFVGFSLDDMHQAELAGDRMQMLSGSASSELPAESSSEHESATSASDEPEEVFDLDNGPALSDGRGQVTGNGSECASDVTSDDLECLTSVDPDGKSAASAGTTPGERKAKRVELRRRTQEQRRKSLQEAKEAERSEKQRVRDMALLKKRLEKEQLLQEKRDSQRKREEEKLVKLRQKEVEKQAKDREREEKRKKKDEEKMLKEQVKQLKDEERRQKEEEKRREEDERARRLQKARSMFSNFFSKQSQADTSALDSDCADLDASTFMQFQVKEHMTVAPLFRRSLSEHQLRCLDHAVATSGAAAADPAVPVAASDLYLLLLASGAHVPGTGRTTVPRAAKHAAVADEDDDEDDVSVCELASSSDQVFSGGGGDGGGAGGNGDSLVGARRPRYKLLQFWENRRPSYWGTWRKSRGSVSARRPLAKHPSLAYEEDSDDDWEQEDPEGESLGGSEKEIESEDDYEVDNEFFVPHGYLSDEEVKDEDEILSPDVQKARLKAKEAEFERQLKRKTRALKPRVIGCVWQSETGATAVDQQHQQQLLAMLSAWAVVPFCRLPLDVAGEEASCDDVTMSPAAGGGGGGSSQEPDSAGHGTKFYKEFPSEALPHLARLVHGNTRSKKVLIREFAKFWNQRSLSSARDTAGDSARDRHATPDRATADELSKCPRDPEPDPTPAAAAVATVGSGEEAQNGTVILSARVVVLKLNAIASYTRCQQQGALFNRYCWLVNPAVISQLQLSLPLPNQWQWSGGGGGGGGSAKHSQPVPPLADHSPAESSSRRTATPPPSPSVAAPAKRRRLITSYTQLVSPRRAVTSPATTTAAAATTATTATNTTTAAAATAAVSTAAVSTAVATTTAISAAAAATTVSTTAAVAASAAVDDCDATKRTDTSPPTSVHTTPSSCSTPTTAQLSSEPSCAAANGLDKAAAAAPSADAQPSCAKITSFFRKAPLNCRPVQADVVDLTDETPTVLCSDTSSAHT